MRCDNRGTSNSLIRFMIPLGPQKMKTISLSREYKACCRLCPGVAEAYPKVELGV